MKIMTILGTRPEIIRLSRVISRLDTTEGITHVLVHTGQNYDYGLNQIFLEELGLRVPDHSLNVDTSSLGTVLGGILIASERVLRVEQPDAVLVLGDTNSAISALMARRMRIPVYHMEAGNRSFDLNVPEETNRKMVDHISDFNLVYTEHARRNLLAEGLHPRRILKTGSPLREVLECHRPQIEASTVHARLGLEPQRYFLVSAHREENVDSRDRLQTLLSSLQALYARYRLPVHVSTHPRTRKRIEALDALPDLEGITFGDPLGFHDYNKLQQEALCCLSDSGSISEEAAILGFRAVTLRDSMERPEALDTGSILMAGLKPNNILLAVSEALSGQSPLGSSPDDYQPVDTSRRVVRYIISTASRHHEWAGVRQPPRPT